jgi:hypothetical protein
MTMTIETARRLTRCRLRAGVAAFGHGLDGSVRGLAAPHLRRAPRGSAEVDAARRREGRSWVVATRRRCLGGGRQQIDRRASGRSHPVMLEGKCQEGAYSAEEGSS